MKKIWYELTLLTLLTTITFQITAQKITYPDGWGPEGYSLTEENSSFVVVNFTIKDFEISGIDLNGEVFQRVLLPGQFLNNEEGAPDLPGNSRYILVPEGAVAEMQIISSRTANFSGVNVVPAPKIPLDTDNQPMVYLKDTSVYNHNAYYPQAPVMIQTGLKIRGMSVALLGITPFQYNPVTKDLIVYRDLQIRVDFQGGSREFGVEKYRSRWWDPIIKDHLLNFSSLPEVDYDQSRYHGSRTFDGCEYLIICPNGAAFQQWADSIKQFRREQGILTEVVTIAEVGGNTATAIEDYINNAYESWDIPPSAVLLLGDHGTDPLTSITSAVLDNHPGGFNPYISDNVYADVDDDQLPDIAFARITARNATELELMVHKFMDYERNPPTDPDFYEHPITALGWQTERWFQICSETIGGYLKNVKGKSPVRINAIYSGDPSVDPWSTATNTAVVLGYFGPAGRGYIPSSPATLGGWTGGTATQINNAINNGSFMLQHRDHGNTTGWGEPAYTTSNISGLTNTDLTFVMSINCQTGKFDNGTETLAEKFHRHQYGGNASGALGLIAPTEVSYSFVNDVFIWGLYDYMWPDFMPTYSSNPVSRGLLPCFGNVAGKYHLQQSTWPAVSTTFKQITYRLFHHHGDAYLTLYSEVPQPLTVSHNSTMEAAQYHFSVTADAGALIALTINGEILATATGTGSSLSISIPGDQIPGQVMVVTATKQNYYRYRSEVNIIPSSGVSIIFDQATIDDSSGNNNGLLDAGEESLLSITVRNVGSLAASNISATLSSSDPLVQVIDSVAFYGNIPAGNTALVTNGYSLELSQQIPDGHVILFEISSSDGTNEWTDYFTLTGHSSSPQMVDFLMDDSGGNHNGKFDAGETVEVEISVSNFGSSTAFNCMVSLSSNDTYIQVLQQNMSYGNIGPGVTVVKSFPVMAYSSTPSGHPVTFDLDIASDNSVLVEHNFNLIVGQQQALVIDLDPNHSSGPAIVTAMAASGVTAQYVTEMPASLTQYQSIFCCLGVYSNNRILTSTEGQLLADYLNTGGRLYLEGGDTWAYDPQTAVHPMFNITGISDGSTDMSTVAGTDGTFAAGLTYTYSGEKNWIDRLSPTTPAATTMENTSPAYVTLISYDQGNYRTIGSSHEFGGLAEGTHTKSELMAKYLIFLGVHVTATWQGLSGQWASTSNWSNKMIPDEGVNVLIPAGGIYPTVFSGGTAHCKSLKVQPGAQFRVPGGVVFTIHQ